jgi:ABC-2 type transport system permease protein
MSTAAQQLRATYAFVERNTNIVKRYWAWEIVWIAYSIADSLAVSFIGLGMGVVEPNAAVDTRYLVLYLAIGTLVWRYLTVIFVWITEIIAIERWEGTIEYTLMAPIHRITHMGGQTLFALAYSLFFTAIVLAANVVMFDINLANANLFSGLVMLLAGSFSFVGLGIMGSVLPLLFPERGQQMTHVIIAMMLLVSGVYYPTEVLPAGLRAASVLSPATYVLRGARAALLEGASVPEIWPHIWPSLITGAVLIPLGLWVFKMAENYAKRNGKLHRNG